MAITQLHWRFCAGLLAAIVLTGCKPQDQESRVEEPKLTSATPIPTPVSIPKTTPILAPVPTPTKEFAEQQQQQQQAEPTPQPTPTPRRGGVGPRATPPGPGAAPPHDKWASDKGVLDEILGDTKPTASVTPSPTDTLPAWFPPKATCQADLGVLLSKICALHKLGTGKNLTLRSADQALSIALSGCGYEQVSHYWLEGDNPGFAIITHFEFIDDLGKPITGHRFEAGLPPVYWYSGLDLLKAILFPNPGRYRLIALVIAQKPIQESSKAMTRGQVEEINHGPNALSDRAWVDKEVTPDFNFTAYVYEFYRESRADDSVTYRTESNISALTHLASVHFQEEVTK